jgi:DNA-binding CsgD family transcriptional regulator
MELLTTGEIAKQLNVDRDMVSYALRKLKIKPNSRAGQVRIFSESALVAVKEFLNSRIERKVRNV